MVDCLFYWCWDCVGCWLLLVGWVVFVNFDFGGWYAIGIVHVPGLFGGFCFVGFGLDELGVLCVWCMFGVGCLTYLNLGFDCRCLGLLC